MPQPPQQNPDPVSLWRDLARRWVLLGSPIRPCAEDVGLMGGMLTAKTDLFAPAAIKTVCLLGVTPEIAAAPWLRDVELVAVERVREMIDWVWPGDTDRRRAVCADWLRAPFPDDSFDLMVGDGCLTPTGFPAELPLLLASIHRCLVPDGYLLLRLFCRPEVTETPAAVIAALHAGAIGSIHAFKWRLAMALQGVTDASDVALDHVWQVWSEARIDVDALAVARGWAPEEIGTMEFYRGSPARNNYMRLDATIEHLRRAGFDLVAVRSGTYELAERCPHVLLRKRRGNSGTATP